MKEWKAPSLNEFDIAERTKNTALEGGDLQTGLGNAEPGEPEPEPGPGPGNGNGNGNGDGNGNGNGNGGAPGS